MAFSSDQRRKRAGVLDAKRPRPRVCPGSGFCSAAQAAGGGGHKIGLVNTAEVLLARSQGTPVKVIAGYLGETIAKIFVPADSPMKTAKELDAKKIGVLSTTHTSYRAVLYVNDKLGIKAEPVALGNLANNASALRAGTVDAIYSAEGAALTLVD